ncbi:hypothetical protein [Halegenticoccus soli]|uniref:hypothetical protein n=1 Tax=Halegenticoccus soli TaxID=1985678 RepID=UPI000C6D8167|nr:hypothetical protein [Halegenticoccus soli]
MPQQGLSTEAAPGGRERGRPLDSADSAQEAAPRDVATGGTGAREAADRIAELEAEVRSLERRLARSEAARRDVIDQYERLISDANRSSARSERSTVGASLLGRLKRLLGSI